MWKYSKVLIPVILFQKQYAQKLCFYRICTRLSESSEYCARWGYISLSTFFCNCWLYEIWLLYVSVGLFEELPLLYIGPGFSFWWSCCKRGWRIASYLLRVSSLSFLNPYVLGFWMCIQFMLIAEDKLHCCTFFLLIAQAQWYDW